MQDGIQINPVRVHDMCETPGLACVGTVAGGRGMAPPLQAPNAEPIALAGEAWPRPHRRPNVEPIA